MRRSWQVQAGYLAEGPRATRPLVEPLAVQGCLWAMEGDGTVALGVRVRARSADEALAVVERRVRGAWPGRGTPVRLGAEVRPVGWTGFRRRRPVLIPGPGTGDPGGTAGVREPRRPRPPASPTSAGVPLPRDPSAR